MNKQLVVLTLLIICIQAKKHTENPIKGDAQCVVKECSDAFWACTADDKCRSKFETCFPMLSTNQSEQQYQKQVQTCLAGNKNSSKLTDCIVKSCLHQSRHEEVVHKGVQKFMETYKH